MGKTAILLGATGATGKQVLKYLLENDRYHKILIFGRRSVAINHPKLEEFVVNLLELETQTERFKADTVFCCIGTTKAKTPDQTLYRSIDYGIPVAAAKLAKANSINCFLVMSSMGANKNSSIFYNRIKGEMEAAILNLEIEHTYILRPSLIAGKREERRFGESVAKYAMAIVNPILLGPLKAFRSIHPETIAKAMLVLATKPYKSGIIPSHKINDLAILWR